MGHGLLTGYTAQALPSMMRADSTIQMTETHKTWISNYFLISKHKNTPLLNYFKKLISSSIIVVERVPNRRFWPESEVLVGIFVYNFPLENLAKIDPPELFIVIFP